LADWSTWWSYTKSYLSDNKTELAKQMGYPAAALVMEVLSYSSVALHEIIYGYFGDNHIDLENEKNIDRYYLWTYRLDSGASIAWSLARGYFTYTGGLTLYNIYNDGIVKSDTYNTFLWIMIIGFGVNAVAEVMNILYGYLYLNLYKTADDIRKQQNQMYTLNDYLTEPQDGVDDPTLGFLSWFFQRVLGPN